MASPLYFLGGGRPGHSKAITLSSQVVGGGIPRMVTKLIIFKRIKVLENESTLQKFPRFMLLKYHFQRKIEHRLENFLIFLKDYSITFKISIF